MRSSLSALTVGVTLGLMWVGGSASPAMACSCTMRSVDDFLAEAGSVYVARSRSFDFLPDHSFEVSRVLKGAPRSNLRLNVITGREESCGTRVRNESYVLIEGPHGFWQLSYCTEDHVGEEAVRKAVALYGEGTAVPSRLDPYWASQYAAPLPLALLGIGLWRRRARKVSG